MSEWNCTPPRDRDVRKTAIGLALLMDLVAGAAPADEASARAKLAEEKVAFTPDAFLQAVANGNVEHFGLFLEAGIDPAVKSAANQTALWLAVERKQLAVLEALLKAGVAPNETNAPVAEYGKTIVFAAVDTGDVAYVRALVDAGADAPPAPAGFPLIFGPVNEGHLEVVKLLLDSGAKLGEHKAALLEAAKTDEMRALLEAAE